MLKIFWPKKDYKKEFQESVEGMTRILMHQIRAKDKDATRNLESLRQLIEEYLALSEKEPNWFLELSINREYAHRIEDSLSGSFFYEDFAETITKITRDIIQIFDTAYEGKEDDVSYETVHIFIAILKKLSSRKGNIIFIKVVLNTLSKLHYEMVNETRPVIHTLSIQWYVATVFGWHSSFDIEYLETFNDYLFNFLKRFPESNNDKIYQSSISSLADGITLPIDCGEQIYNFYFLIRSPEEQLPYTFRDLEQVLNGASFGNSIKSIQERCQQLDNIIDALLPFATSEVKLDEILENKEKAKKAIVSRYAYSTLIETLFITASYFLFKKKYSYIYYLWEYHQPSDADATWCGENIIPETLNGLFSLYFKNIYLERRHRHFDDHHGASGYYFHYFILSAMRLISQKEQTPIDLKSFSLSQKSSIKDKLDSIISTSIKLSKDQELMRSLGFKLEEADDLLAGLESYVLTIKSKIESERETILISKSPNQTKIDEFKEDFIKGFNEGASAREWLVQSGLFDNKVAEESPSEGDRYGISILLDKEMFFEEWDISYLDFGHSMGNDMGTDESKTIFEKIASFCEPIITDEISKVITDSSIKLENIAIFASNRFFHYSLDRDSKYLPDWRIPDKKLEYEMFKGYYQINEHDIPIYFMPSNKSNCLLLDHSRLGRLIQHNPLSPKDRSGSELYNEIFYFYLRAFSEDPELLQFYLENATGKTTKEEYLKKKMLFEVHERFHFEPASNFCGYSLTSKSKKRRGIET